MVFVSHDLALVAEVANSITVMYAGQIVEQGSVHDILTNPIHEYTRGLLGSVLSIEAGSGRLHQVPGSVPSPQTSRRATASPRVPAIPMPFRTFVRFSRRTAIRITGTPSCLTKRWRVSA